MTIETNKALILRWVEEGWNAGDLAVVDALYAPNVVQHDPSSPVPVTSSEAGISAKPETSRAENATARPNPA